MEKKEILFIYIHNSARSQGDLQPARDDSQKRGTLREIVVNIPDE